MNSRTIPLFFAALIASGLHGEEPASRYGVAIGASAPQELKASPGINIGFNVYLNQNLPNEGRIRMEGVNFGKKSENNSSSTFESEGNAFTLAYDWIPADGMVRGVIGVGVMSWTQSVQQFNLGYKSYGGTKNGFALVPTLGVQFRVSKSICIEGRYALAANVTNDSKYFFSYGADNSVRKMNYLSLGVEIRIPRLR